ncbi:MAG: NAD(P)-dependent oxidoreductase [Candidatus Altiarchaeota archaeon]|nr:NAD(P)-dependent oxidoreductase [Candidatus Altiarchaeota archaeon]
MIVITGGSGFIGTALVKRLKKLKREFKVLDINSKNGDATVVDITNKEALENEFEKGDIIVHLAALINAHESDEMQEKYFDVNIMGTQNVVNASEKKECKKIIFPSSAAVYSSSEKGKVTEKTKTNPDNYYGITKVEGEKIVLASRTPNVILRFSNAYGISGSGIINKFIKKIKTKESLSIWSSGNQKRDFIHIDDIIDAILLAINSGRGLYNISTSKNISINQLAKLILKLSQTNLEIKHIEVEESQIKYVMSNELAKKDLGFSPKIKLEDGIKGLL